MWTSPWETYYISTHLPLCNVMGASPANELKIPAHVRQWQMNTVCVNKQASDRICHVPVLCASDNGK